jgi:heptosyltransferase III
MPEHFLISRSDAIGDVVLTLPVAVVLKEKFPDCKITWIGRTYTKEVIEACSAIDAFFNYEEWIKQNKQERIETLKRLKSTAIIHVYPRKELAKAAKQAGIQVRIGTSHRVFHWLTCNKLVNLGRKNSELHETQLNLRLLEPLGIPNKTIEELRTPMPIIHPTISLPEFLSTLVNHRKIKIILHPRSQGSAREWGPENYLQLIKLLPEEKYQVFITGTEKEGESLNKFLKDCPSHVINLTGKLTLAELISFINSCDGLVAASTGPLHLAASLGKNAIGIYPPIRPMHGRRWGPLGKKALYLSANSTCNQCRKSPQGCTCMGLVTPKMIAEKISTWE